MIKDDVVLTAAHNIYDRKKIAAADEIYVIGNQKDKAHVRCYSKFKVPFDYVAQTSQDGHYDWGLIKLNAPMRDLGVIEVMKAVPGIVSETALIAGYPSEVRSVSTTDMWEASGAFDKYDMTSQTLKYKISTSGGNSGSPVVVDYNRRKAAVGIHVMGSVAENTAKSNRRRGNSRNKQVLLIGLFFLECPHMADLKVCHMGVFQLPKNVI